MEINNLMFNYIKNNIPKDILEPNSIFNGEIVDIEGDAIFVKIPGKGLIKAESEIDLKSLLGQNIKFVVESKTEGRIEIRPMVDEEGKPINTKLDDSITKVLKDLNIKDTELTKDLVRNLMKYDIPLKKEVISEAIRTLDKLIELSDLDKEGLEFIDPDKLQKDEESLKTQNKNQEIKPEVKGESLSDKDIPISKEELKSLGMKDNLGEKLDGLVEDMEEYTDIKKEISGDIKNILTNDKGEIKQDGLKDLVGKMLSEFNIESGEEDFLETITFMTKNNIKPSLNNIKNLKDVFDDPFEFTRETRGLIDRVEKEILPLKEKIETIEKEIEKLDPEKDKHIIDEKKKDMPRLKESDKRDLIDLKNKADFIKDLNKDMLFQFVPVNYGEREMDGLVNFLKEKDSRESKDDRINIFINLDTNNLGKVTVSCQANLDKLNVVVGINEEDRALFELGLEVLKGRIESLGYDVESIKFVGKEEINLVDEMTTNTDPMHFLDIKV